MCAGVWGATAAFEVNNVCHNFWCEFRSFMYSLFIPFPFYVLHGLPFGFSFYKATSLTHVYAMRYGWCIGCRSVFQRRRFQFTSITSITSNSQVKSLDATDTLFPECIPVLTYETKLNFLLTIFWVIKFGLTESKPFFFSLFVSMLRRTKRQFTQSIKYK